MHPWHDIEMGLKSPEEFTVVVEISAGSKVKYELDKKTGLLCMDRILHSSVCYPANYGFVPRTYCEDRDPLDALILSQCALIPFCVTTVRPLGIVRMIDQGEADDKLITVPVGDPLYAHYHEVQQLPPHQLLEIRQFFEEYKVLEKKKVQVLDIKGSQKAKDIIQRSSELYQQERAKLRRDG